MRHKCRSYLGAIDGANLKTRRVHLADLFLEVFVVIEGLVSQVDLVLESKGEFAVCELAGRLLLVIQPQKYGFEWIKPVVEHLHDFW